MSKSNILVFRKVGYLISRERWCYGTVEITVVNAYKYLVIYFLTKHSFNFTYQDLASREKRALLGIMSTLYKLDKNSADLYGTTSVNPTLN